MRKLDDLNPVQVAKDIWWVGFADTEAGFSNNPYLLIDGDECVLFDPGPGHAVFRDVILEKIVQLIDPRRIRYMVVHHQDPDLCALIPFIEDLLHPEVVLLAHPRTALFVPYYGIRTPILPLGDDDVLRLKSGREIRFLHMPHLHFSGNMLSFDPATGSLFSSDLFSEFNRNWSLFAEEGNLERTRYFLEHYMGSSRALQHCHRVLSALPLKQILPQHGAILRKDLDRYLAMLLDVDTRSAFQGLGTKAGADPAGQMVTQVKTWLEGWLERPVPADSVRKLVDVAAEDGLATLALLHDKIADVARSLGTPNPLHRATIHSGSHAVAAKDNVVEGLRRRMMTRTMGGKSSLAEESTIDLVTGGLASVRVDLAILFVDIRGFTRWSEGREPTEIIELLSQQSQLQANVIRRHGGRVNKLMGDGMLAYFSAARVHSAVLAAVEIQQETQSQQLLPVGVGCSFGEVVMGEIGQESRLDFTILGAAVNHAARMCDIARPGEVCLTEAILTAASPHPELVPILESPTKTLDVQVKKGDPRIRGVRIEVTDQK